MNTLLNLELFQLPFYYSVIALILIRPLSVLLHLLGYTLVLSLVSKTNVTLYIGSKLNTSKSVQIFFKRISFVIHKNPLNWWNGCYSFKGGLISTKYEILVVLTGLMTPVALTIISYEMLILTDRFDVFFSILLISSIVDFIIHVTPFNLLFFNDGSSLLYGLHLLKLKKNAKSALEFYQNKDYNAAVQAFEELLLSNKAPYYYRMALISTLQCRNYEKALDLINSFKTYYVMDFDDKINESVIYMELGFFKKALDCIHELLELEPDNVYLLNNKGYTFLL